METTIIKVTPKIAAAWLETNTINRPLRRSVVDSYIAAYCRGEHKLTHQGIAFAESGELLDGQHRLTALSEMPASFSAEFMVTRGLPKTAFDAIDQGLKRTHSDVLHVTPGLAAVARYMATIHETSRTGITSQFLVPFIRGTEERYAQLTGFCPKNTKTWSSAAIRTAAILRMVNGGDKDYICVSYYALNHAEFDSMSPIVQAFYRQQVKGLVSTRGFDIFCRAYKAFDSRSQNLTTLQINDTSSVITKVREIIQSKILSEGPATPARKRVPARPMLAHAA